MRGLLRDRIATLGAVFLVEMARSAGIDKKGSCHLLRHTVATLMPEEEADIRYVFVDLVRAWLNPRIRVR